MSDKLAVPVIKRTHYQQAEEAVRGSMIRMGRKRSPMDQLQVLHTAEEELLTVSPLLMENDRQGRTVTEGFYGAVAAYQVAFVEIILEYKRKYLVPQASAGVGAERLREIRCEVVTDHSTVISEILAGTFHPHKIVLELNSLERSSTSCLLSVHNALEDRIGKLGNRIAELELRRTQIQTSRERRFFGVRLKPALPTRVQHEELKAIATSLPKLREERSECIAERDRKKRDLSATMEVLMDFIALKKKQVLGLR